MEIRINKYRCQIFNNLYIDMGLDLKRIKLWIILFIATMCLGASPTVFSQAEQDEFLASQYIYSHLNWLFEDLDLGQSSTFMQQNLITKLGYLNDQSAVDYDFGAEYDDYLMPSNKLQNQNRETMDYRVERRTAPMPRLKPTIYQMQGIHSQSTIRVETDDKIIISVAPKTNL